MESRIYLAFMVIVVMQAIGVDKAGGKKLKPEVGREDCEWYMLGEDVNYAWEGTWQRECELDDKGKTRKAGCKTGSLRVPGLYDPCCTEYIGLVCHPIENHKYSIYIKGSCGKPKPYHNDKKVNQTQFLKLMKKKKMDEGFQLDDRWAAI